MGRAKKSKYQHGRTIGEQRERLESASERQAAHQKSVRKKRRRVILVTIGFILVAACPVALYFFLVNHDGSPLFQPEPEKTYAPTIEIVDEDAASGQEISTRTKNYIGQAEADFRDLGYIPEKAVIPSGAVREVDFYLKDQPGYVKMLIDRDTAPSVEDADRLLRYLKNDRNVTEFEYIDVRLAGKAYWK